MVGQVRTQVTSSRAAHLPSSAARGADGLSVLDQPSLSPGVSDGWDAAQPREGQAPVRIPQGLLPREGPFRDHRQAQHPHPAVQVVAGREAWAPAGEDKRSSWEAATGRFLRRGNHTRRRPRRASHCRAPRAATAGRPWLRLVWEQDLRVYSHRPPPRRWGTLRSRPAQAAQRDTGLGPRGPGAGQLAANVCSPRPSADRLPPNGSRSVTLLLRRRDAGARQPAGARNPAGATKPSWGHRGCTALPTRPRLPEASEGPSGVPGKVVPVSTLAGVRGEMLGP